MRKDENTYNISMILDDVTPEDAGKYTVVIKNFVGEDSYSIILTIDDGMYIFLSQIVFIFVSLGRYYLTE